MALSWNEIKTRAAKLPDASLADFYNPDLITPDLVKVHNKLDRLEDKAYGETFTDNGKHVAFVFGEYLKLNEGLFFKGKKLSSV